MMILDIRLTQAILWFYESKFLLKPTDPHIVLHDLCYDWTDPDFKEKANWYSSYHHERSRPSLLAEWALLQTMLIQNLNQQWLF